MSMSAIMIKGGLPLTAGRGALKKFSNHQLNVQMRRSASATTSRKTVLPGLRHVRRSSVLSEASLGSFNAPGSSLPLNDTTLWERLRSRIPSVKGVIRPLERSLRPKAHRLFRSMTKERDVLAVRTNISNICGHGSFLMLAVGYLEYDVLSLRAFTVSGIALSILFQYYRPQPLWIPISWNMLFFLINGGMILQLLRERSDASNLEAEDEKEVFAHVFQKLGLSPIEFLHLIRMAERKDIPAGHVMAVQGVEQEYMYLIVDGNAEVISDDESIGSITSHQYVGSMAFLRFLNSVDEELENHQQSQQVITISEEDGTLIEVESEPEPTVEAQTEEPADEAPSVRASTTTVVATTPCHVFQWDFHVLRAYLRRHLQEGNAMQVSVSADLTRKLDQSRDPNRRYRQLLLTSLTGGELMPMEKQKLKRYRDIHGISSGEHDSMLNQLGWSKQEYAAGYHHDSITKAFAKYEEMLAKSLAGKKLSDENRVALRRFRVQNGIDPQEHLLALNKLGWSYEAYESGERSHPAPAPRQTMRGPRFQTAVVRQALTKVPHKVHADTAKEESEVVMAPIVTTP